MSPAGKVLASFFILKKLKSVRLVARTKSIYLYN